MIYGSKPYTKRLTTRDIVPFEIQAQLIDILNQTLATTVDLKTQVKQAVWNVKSMNFCHLYELFDEIAMDLEIYVDLLGERITNLGGLAMGTARIAVKRSIIPEYPLHITDGQEHIASVAERLAIYGTLLWDNIDRTALLGDADTANLYAEISTVIDKRLWFLDACLMTSSVDDSHQLASRN